MARAATPSRSAVVMPGRAAARTASSADATTRPARRMTRTCSSVLSSTRSREPKIMACATSAELGGQRLDDALGDVGDLADAVHLGQQAALRVRRRERRRLLVVDVEATGDRVRGVVVAALDLGALGDAGQQL